MTTSLQGKRIATLATNGFEQSELMKPVEALRDAGATVHIVAPETGRIRGWSSGDWGDEVDVDSTIERADASTYDALLIPGGVMSPDTLRGRDDAVAFAREFFKAGKPVSAICHGPQLLVDCDVLRDREVTSYHSIRADLENAGARWVDKEVVTDSGLTTSRTPDDLDAFIGKTIEEIAEGVHAGQTTA